MIKQLFERYGALIAEADRAFQEVQEAHGPAVNCRRGCADCCHAVFGLFPIEAVHLRSRFERLDRKTRRAALSRGKKSEEKIEGIRKRLKPAHGGEEAASEALARERVRCPLLDEGDRCILYPWRPLTCRVYGIPTFIQGKPHVCAQGGFKRGESYPFFDLDQAYRELYGLSKELFRGAGRADLEEAGLMIAVPVVIKTEIRDLVGRSLTGLGEAS